MRVPKSGRVARRSGQDVPVIVAILVAGDNDEFIRLSVIKDTRIEAADLASAYRQAKDAAEILGGNECSAGLVEHLDALVHGLYDIERAYRQAHIRWNPAVAGSAELGLTKEVSEGTGRTARHVRFLTCGGNPEICRVLRSGDPAGV